MATLLLLPLPVAAAAVIMVADVAAVMVTVHCSCWGESQSEQVLLQVELDIHKCLSNLFNLFTKKLEIQVSEEQSYIDKIHVGLVWATNL